MTVDAGELRDLVERERERFGAQALSVVVVADGEPLEDLADRYAHPAYDLLEVSADDGVLQAAWHEIEGITVRHRGADVWDLGVPRYDMALTLSFRSGPHGVEDVLVPLEPTVDAVVIRRLPPELPAQDEARLLGTYAMGELRLQVVREAGGVVADVRGVARLSLEPRSATRFTVPGRSGVLADFLAPDGGVASRVVLTPYGVFDRVGHA